MTQTEPTPIEDWLFDQDLMRLHAKLAAVSFAIMLVGRYAPAPMWIEAGAGLGWIIFSTIAITMFAWRQYKQWRYPTSYEESA